MLVHTFNASAEKAEAGGSLSSRSAVSIEFQNSQGYPEKLCLEKPASQPTNHTPHTPPHTHTKKTTQSLKIAHTF